MSASDVGVAGLPLHLHLLCLLLCLLLLWAQTALILSYLNSKSLAQISLGDHISRDLVLLHLFSFSALVAAKSCQAADLRLPPAIAFVLAHLTEYLGACFLVTLTAGTAVKLALVRAKKVNLAEQVSDEVLFNLLRAATAASTALVFAGRFAAGSYSDLYADLAGLRECGGPTASAGGPPSVGAAVMAVLGFVAFVFNVAARVIISREKSKLPDASASAAAIPAARRHACVAVAFVALALSMVAARLGGFYGVASLVAVAAFTVAAPGAVLIGNAKMRKHALRVLRRGAEEAFGSCHCVFKGNAVDPAPPPVAKE